MRASVILILAALAGCSFSPANASPDGSEPQPDANVPVDALTAIDAPTEAAAPADAGNLPTDTGTVADSGRPVVAPCVDADGDGFFRDPACAAAQGYPVDCNDLDSHVHPGAVEFCDGIDENCDGHADDDTDPLRTPRPGFPGAGVGTSVLDVWCQTSARIVEPGWTDTGFYVFASCTYWDSGVPILPPTPRCESFWSGESHVMCWTQPILATGPADVFSCY